MGSGSSPDALLRVSQTRYFEVRALAPTRCPTNGHVHGETHEGRRQKKDGTPTKKTIRMPAPSQLSIATSVLNRLVKEEKSYYKESEQQQASITKLEQQGANSNDENVEYQLKQEVRLTRLIITLSIAFLSSILSLSSLASLVSDIYSLLTPFTA